LGAGRFLLVGALGFTEATLTAEGGGTGIKLSTFGVGVGVIGGTCIFVAGSLHVSLSADTKSTP